MKLKHTILSLSLALATTGAHPASTSFVFNYMATNGKGDFATASGDTASPVARLDLEDLANNAGVRATFQVLPNGLSQFSSGTGTVYISAFELNFPGTCQTDPGTGLPCGYDFVNVSGVPLAGGVEWEENGATDGWGADPLDPSFEQEYNWGNTGILNQTNGRSVIDILNEPGKTNISVASLLANPVSNFADPTKPDAYAWIKIRSLNQGINAADGSNWWGTPIANANGGRLNVLAIAPVPEPSEYAMIGLGLGVLAFAVRRRGAVSA